MFVVRPRSRHLMHLLVPAASLAVLCIATAAKADTLDYTLTAPGETVTWSISTTATPNVISLGQGFIYDSIPVTVNGTTHNEEVAFGNALGPAGVLDVASDITFETYGETYGGNVVYLFGSQQLYSGLETDPTFLTGTYSIVNVLEGTNFPPVNPDTLVITDVSSSPAAAPEPSGLLLLGTGMAGIAGLLRRRLRFQHS